MTLDQLICKNSLKTYKTLFLKTNILRGSKPKKLPSRKRRMFFRWLTVIINSIEGFIIFRKADCPQLGNHQKQHVGTKQEEPHGGPRWSQSSPSSEIPLSYLENRNSLERSPWCDETFSFVISSIFTTSSLRCPLPPGALAVVGEVSLKTQAKDGNRPGLMEASGEHIEVWGTFARVFEVTMYVITARSPEPQTEMLAADLARRWAKLGLEF